MQTNQIRKGLIIEDFFYIPDDTDWMEDETRPQNNGRPIKWSGRRDSPDFPKSFSKKSGCRLHSNNLIWKRRQNPGDIPHQKLILKQNNRGAGIRTRDPMLPKHVR